MKTKNHIIPCIAAILLLQSCDTSSVDTLLEEDPQTEASASLLSGIVPTDVFIPNPSDSNVLNRPAFDEFSWQLFIALSWPLDGDNRGVALNPTDPSTFLSMSNMTPVVWTSFKNQADIFDQGNFTPSPWSSWTSPVPTCSDYDSVDHRFLGSMAGELNESFSVPLVDQDSNYASFELLYNQVQYDFIVSNGLYDSKKLSDYKKANNGAIMMPVSTAEKEGSIMIKTSWKKMTASDDESRFYVIDEVVYDPITETCSREKMGLVGFHIAQKTANFPQWVWSTFEQVDNVPNDPGGEAPYSYNNGTNSPSTGIHGYANMPDAGYKADKSDRVPVQVNRLNPVPTTPADSSTVDINVKYRTAVAGTWMANYQLVVTQWPSNPDNFTQYNVKGASYPDSCGAAFPVANCVNTTMETYFQLNADAVSTQAPAIQGANSCMGCHYGASPNDFSYSLQLRAHPVFKTN